MPNELLILTRDSRQKEPEISKQQEIETLLHDLRGTLTATIIMFPDFDDSFRPMIVRIDKIMGQVP